MYNLRGDVIATYGSDKSLKSAYMYNPFGTKETRYGDIKTDSHRANTKVEDSGNLLNEGKRFRQLEYGIFLTPDPLEYVDGYNPYIYCGQNPWGKWDPLGLLTISNTNGSPSSGSYPYQYTFTNFNPSIYGAWMKANVKSDVRLDPKKRYVLAAQVNLTNKGKTTKVLVLRIIPPEDIKDGNFNKDYLKIYLQDGFNKVNILINPGEDSIQAEAYAGIYEVDPNNIKSEGENKNDSKSEKNKKDSESLYLDFNGVIFKDSGIRVADYQGGSRASGTPIGQRDDDISVYAKSAIGKINALVNEKYNDMDSLKTIKGLIPVDISKEANKQEVR